MLASAVTNNANIKELAFNNTMLKSFAGRNHKAQN